MASSIEITAADGHIVHGAALVPEKQRGFALLVHGITADRHEWGFFDALGSELQRLGFASLAIDYRGHGASNWPIARLSLAGIILDIEAAWRFASGEISKVNDVRIMVGNSFGGGLALIVASLLVRCDQVVGTCPVFSYVDDLARVNGDWRREAEGGDLKYASKRLPASIVPEMYAFDAIIDRLPHSPPLTVFHGTMDSDVPIAASEDFVRQGRGVLKPMTGMDHSFSAPEGVPDREAATKEYRERAAREIAAHIGAFRR